MDNKEKPEEKVTKTYKIGNTEIKINAPKSISDEEKERILKTLYRIGREILKKREVRDD